MRIWLLLLVAGCPSPPDDTPEDTVPDTPEVLDTSIPVDTEDVWETGLVDGPLDFDTYVVTDPPIGSTDIDGVYGGSIRIEHYLPITQRDPGCDGGITITIDGDGGRHAVVEIACDGWAPQPGGIIGTYGALQGIGYGTLDPNDLTRFTADISLSAPGMTGDSVSDVPLRVDGDTITFDHDGTVGFLGFRTGFVLTGTATKGQSAPVPGAP